MKWEISKNLLMPNKRSAFFISDRTGITVEMLGHSLLAQFSDVEFEQVAIPFVDNKDKAHEVLRRINAAGERGNGRPIVFSTLVDPEVKDLIGHSDALVFDCFQTFIVPLEQELGVSAVRKVGLSHSINNPIEYHHRIETINFTMSHDDGMQLKDLELADVILIGVSRCGKTPTCLYMALQFGIRAANYPLVPEDLDRGDVPESLKTHQTKLFGLTIDPERLRQIRNERRPGSTYASLDTCKREVKLAEKMMRHAGISFLDTSTKSIEEISTTILQEAKLMRHIY